MLYTGITSTTYDKLLDPVFDDQENMLAHSSKVIEHSGKRVT